MLNVGLIGLGPEWERRYRPALAKLRHRLRVRCVHTPVITHAEQVAAELQCQVATGLMRLVERDDVQALLVLDTSWYSGVPANFACQVRKPAYLAGSQVPRTSLTDQLLRRAAESGVTLMPEFGHRYTPATSRLRELIATRLGRPLELVVDVATAVDSSPDDTPSLSVASRELLAMTVDWCLNVVGTAPASVRVSSGGGLLPESKTGPLEIRVEFRQPAAGGPAAVACVRLNAASGSAVTDAESDSADLQLQARVQCLKGIAWLTNPDQVKWESADDKKTESLTSDRPDVEVMLDLFTRRVVGGLIPVPTLEDLLRAHQLIESALAVRSG